MVGKTISHYEILEKIGEGGMGAVYKARDTRLGRTVAIKVVNAEFTQRFEREARAIAALNHPHICTLHDVGEHEGAPYLVMEYVEGKPLKGPLPTAEALRYAIQICQALAAAHKAGIVHRDLKPDNILLTSEGSVKVLDFGLAKLQPTVETDAPTLTTETMTEQGTIAGTGPYMSPEQARGEPVDTRSDIFSFGAVLYELLSGRRAFRRETMGATLAAVITQEPPPLPAEVPHELERVVTRCLRKDVSYRYQRIDEVRAELEAIQPRAALAIQTGWKYLLLRRRWLVIEAAVLMVAIAAFWALVTHRAPLTSIAVLPLTNVNGMPEADFLSQGISESVITSLSGTPGLRVLPSDSALHYAGKDKRPQEIGRELGVDTLLRGRLLQQGEAVSIGVELVRTDDAAVLWSQQWQRQSADLLEIERDIAWRVRRKLAAGPESPPASPTANPDAFRLYLQGRYFWNTRTAESLRKSTESFQKAIDVDPNYALAWAGLADSFLMLGGWSVLEPKDAYPRARAAAMRAIALDQSLAEPHATLGYLKTIYEWDWPGADREFRRALELNPDYATAHHWYAYYHQTLGDFAASLTDIERARQLDPLSHVINSEVSLFYTYARQYDRALLEVRKMAQLEPARPKEIRLAIAYALLGRRREALNALEEIPVVAERGANFVVAYVLIGERDKAQAVLQGILALSRERYVNPAAIAKAYAVLGDGNRAFEYYNQSIDNRSLVPSWLREPGLDVIRSDPRYRALFARLGLKP